MQFIDITSGAKGRDAAAPKEMVSLQLDQMFHPIQPYYDVFS